jgi:hypothetical protein
MPAKKLIAPIIIKPVTSRRFTRPPLPVAKRYPDNAIPPNPKIIREYPTNLFCMETDLTDYCKGYACLIFDIMPVIYEAKH